MQFATPKKSLPKAQLLSSRRTSSQGSLSLQRAWTQEAYDPAAIAASTPSPGSNLSFPEVPAYTPSTVPSPALTVLSSSPRQPAQLQGPRQTRGESFPSPPPKPRASPQLQGSQSMTSLNQRSSRPPRSPARSTKAAAAQEAANRAAADRPNIVTEVRPNIVTEVRVVEGPDGEPQEIRVHLPNGFPGRMPMGFRMPAGRMPAGIVSGIVSPTVLVTPPRAGSHLSTLPPEAAVALPLAAAPPPRAGSHLSMFPPEAAAALPLAAAAPPRAGSHLSTFSPEAAAALPLVAAPASAAAPGLASTLHRNERLARARRANSANRELSTDRNESAASPALSSKTRLAGAATGTAAPGVVPEVVPGVTPSSLTSTLISQAREKLRTQNLVCGLNSRKSDSSVLHELARRPSRERASSGPARGRVVPKATPGLDVSLLAHTPTTLQHDAAPPHNVSGGLSSPLLQGVPFAECRQVAGGPGGHGAIWAPGAICPPTTVLRPATQHAQHAPREAATKDGSCEATGSEPGGATRASDSMETASPTVPLEMAGHRLDGSPIPSLRRASRWGCQASRSTEDAITSMSAAAATGRQRCIRHRRRRRGDTTSCRPVRPRAHRTRWR